ncbi:MAG: hypothetical protein RDV41_03515 [Planctomycetota bacterium]|nr:hypothetical protein [Planctomycetota bacterium]
MKRLAVLVLLLASAVVVGCGASAPKIAVNGAVILSEFSRFEPVEGDKVGTKKYLMTDLLGPRQAVDPADAGRQESLFSKETLVAALRTCVAPESWSSIREAATQWDGDHLCITNIPSVITKSEKFFEGLRAEKDSVLAVDLRIVKARPDAFSKWNAGFQPVASSGSSAGNALVAVCRSTEVQEWIKDAEKRGGITLTSAPRITSFPMQKFQMLLYNQMAFISGYDVTVADDGSATTVDPLVGTTNAGLAVGDRALRVPGEENCVLFFRIELVATPPSYKIARLQSAQTTELKLQPVEVPNTWKKEISGKLLVPFDAAAVILLPTEEQDQLMAVIATLVPIETQ